MTLRRLWQERRRRQHRRRDANGADAALEPRHAILPHANRGAAFAQRLERDGARALRARHRRSAPSSSHRKSSWRRATRLPDASSLDRAASAASAPCSRKVSRLHRPPARRSSTIARFSAALSWMWRNRCSSMPSASGENSTSRVKRERPASGLRIDQQAVAPAVEGDRRTGVGRDDRRRADDLDRVAADPRQIVDVARPTDRRRHWRTQAPDGARHARMRDWLSRRDVMATSLRMAYFDASSARISTPMLRT